MVMEVYLGARPGRPQTLVVLCAALLAGSLGLAWYQVHNLRALGPEQQVADTPIWVQLPRGWLADPKDPHRFFLPARQGSGPSAVLRQRSIRFSFDRLATFVSHEQLLQILHLDNPRTSLEVRAARLGPYDGLEVHQRKPVALGRTLVEREIITRCTCLPRGQVIEVTYETLDRLRLADEEILADVCQTLRIDEPTVTRTRAELLQRAGLECQLDPNWLVVGPHFDEVPGFYVGGSTDGVPTWALGVFRTWLADGRTPADLLEDMAAEQWQVSNIDPMSVATARDDARTILHIRHPRAGHVLEPPVSAWVISEAPELAVLIFVYAGREVRLADTVAERLATSLVLSAFDDIPPVASLERAGQELVAKLNARGPVPRWGREPAEANYVGHSSFASELVSVQRAARNRDPNAGYTGSLRRWTRYTQGMSFAELAVAAERSVPTEEIEWVYDGRQGTYEWSQDRAKTDSVSSVRERRARRGGGVERAITTALGAVHRRQYQPGAGFAPPPVEEIVMGWVARNEASAAIIEVSSTLGPATHTLLLRHLPADGDLPRVFLQRDYWPTGAIQAYDDDWAETEYELSPTATYRRHLPGE